MVRWTGARHLAALRAHIVPGPGTVTLDRTGYAAEVLATTDDPGEDWVQLVPHILATAVCPVFGPAEDDGTFVTLHDGTRVRMGDCPWVDRVRAARLAMGVEDDAVSLCPVRVAETVLAQVWELAQTDEPITIAQLDAPALVQLAAALLDRYDRALTDEDLEEFEMGEWREFDESAEQVRMVLALHRSLGRLRVPPHSPPRRDQPETRWPPRSRPPDPPLLVAAL